MRGPVAGPEGARGLDWAEMKQELVLRGSGQCRHTEVGRNKVYMSRDKWAERPGCS